MLTYISIQQMVIVFLYTVRLLLYMWENSQYTK